MNDPFDPRPPARRSRSAEGFSLERALLGWFLLGVGALCLYLLFAPIYGEMVPWKLAWASAIFLAAGTAFRTSHWFQRHEQRRRAGRKVRRNRTPWPLHRCLAMMFTGASLFTIGWCQLLCPADHYFILGTIIAWTSYVGSGGGMLLVGLWELHRRLSGRSLEAVASRRRMSAHGGVLVWGAMCAVCVLCAVGAIVAFLDSIERGRANLLGFVVIMLIVCSGFAGAALRLRATLREASRPHRSSRRSVARAARQRTTRRRRKAEGVLEWIGDDRAP